MSGRYIQGRNGKMQGSTPGWGAGRTRNSGSFDTRTQSDYGYAWATIRRKGGGEAVEVRSLASRRGGGSGAMGYSESQSEALNHYADGNTFSEVKKKVTSGETYELPKSGKSLTSELDSAIASTELGEDTVSYRAMRLPKDTIATWDRGTVITHDFYMSTTTDAGSARTYGLYGARKKASEENVMLTVLSPKGTPVAPGAESLSELIFARGTEAQIQSIMNGSDRVIITVTMRTKGEKDD